MTIVKNAKNEAVEAHWNLAGGQMPECLFRKVLNSFLNKR